MSVPALFQAPLTPPPLTVVRERVELDASKMYGREELITAAEAAEYLGRARLGTDSLRQRPLTPSVVARFERIISRGEWQPVPPGLVVTPDGNVINGQHRLQAQVNMGVSLLWYVIRNCPPAMFALLDTDLPRRGGQVLYMSGHAKGTAAGNHLDSAARLFMAVLRQRAELRARAEDPTAIVTSWAMWARTKPSTTEVLDFIGAHPKFDESVQVGDRVRKRSAELRVSQPAVAVLHRMVLDQHPKSEEALNRFLLDQVGEGQMIGGEDPAFVFRRWVGRGMPATEYGKNHRTDRERALMGLGLAWNAFAEDRRLKSISFGPSTPFPALLEHRPRVRSGQAGSSGRA